jgi:hypothetical protein
MSPKFGVFGTTVELTGVLVVTVVVVVLPFTVTVVVDVCEYDVVIKRHDNNDTKNKDILSFL